MKILLVKLSSLGDVVQTLPVIHDIRSHVPGAHIDWVVEEGFEPLVRQAAGLERVIPRAAALAQGAGRRTATRDAWRALSRADLKREAYDAVIDLQGLTKSAR